MMHYAHGCISLEQKAWAEAPLKDGEPDFSRVKVYGLVLTKSCGVIQVKH